MGSESKALTNSIGSRIYKVFLENEVRLKRFLRRYSSNSQDIDDISQETILRALNAEKNKQILEPKAFLFGVAKNIVRKSLDKKSRSLIDFIEDFGAQEYLSNEPGEDERLDSQRRMLVFWEAVADLPMQCQRVFVLKKVHGYSHKEISECLAISISTAEKHVAMGLKRCSEQLALAEKAPEKSKTIIALNQHEATHYEIANHETTKHVMTKQKQ